MSDAHHFILWTLPPCRAVQYHLASSLRWLHSLFSFLFQAAKDTEENKSEWGSMKLAIKVTVTEAHWKGISERITQTRHFLSQPAKRLQVRVPSVGPERREGNREVADWATSGGSCDTNQQRKRLEDSWTSSARFSRNWPACKRCKLFHYKCKILQL